MSQYYTSNEVGAHKPTIAEKVKEKITGKASTTEEIPGDQQPGGANFKSSTEGQHPAHPYGDGQQDNSLMGKVKNLLVPGKQSNAVTPNRGGAGFAVYGSSKETPQ